MRLGALLGARAALVAGPVALAFFSGGFFDRPRDIALLAAGVVLAVLVATAPSGAIVPPGRAARAALVAAAAYAGWIALSATWAPVGDYAGDDAERALLYATVLAAAAIAFRERSAARALEPLAAAGAAIVIGYGIAGRLLPGIVTEHPQRSAVGRLDQPLTYWNATGALAAIGLVLCARIAGDVERRPALRAAAAAAAVPLGMGCYLSFSRGALAALAAGLLTLVVLAPTFAQLRGALLIAVAGAGAAIAAAASPAVRAIEGSAAAREREGAIVLAVAVVLMAVAALAAVIGDVRLRRGPLARLAGRSDAPMDRPLPLPRWSGWAALVAIAALLVVPIAAAGGRQQAPPATGATNERFASLGSNRYGYWRVALDTGLDHPLAGVGASGFRVAWLQHRDVDENVRDAHSLELETFAELGLIGVAILAALLGAVALSTRAAHRVDPALAAGPAAALTAWAFHSAIDWDWEMPALTLVAVMLAGALLAVGDQGRG
jgi:O-antigen ligase/polysaccharide polymerase Wzy-like membrane protein